MPKEQFRWSKLFSKSGTYLATTQPHVSVKTGKVFCKEIVRLLNIIFIFLFFILLEEAD